MQFYRNRAHCAQFTENVLSRGVRARNTKLVATHTLTFSNHGECKTWVHRELLVLDLDLMAIHELVLLGLENHFYTYYQLLIMYNIKIRDLSRNGQSTS